MDKIEEQKISRLFPDILRIEAKVQANPISMYSKPYTKEFVLTQEDELKIVLQCPNGTCTDGFYDFPTSDLQKAVEKSLRESRPIRIERECCGWEDEKRRNKFRCGTSFTLTLACFRKSRGA